MSLVSLGLIAQQTPHEISVNIAGGLSYMNVKTNHDLSLDKSNKNDLKFGIGYAYNFNSSFAIVTGVDIAFNKVDLTLNEFQGSYLEIDREADIFKFVYKGDGCKEKVKTTYFHIPIMARYTYKINEQISIYGSAGTKIGFKQKAKFDSNIGNLTTEGGYFNYAGTGDEVPTIGDIPTEGLGTFENISQKGDIKMKTQISGALELGMRYKLSEANALYFGAYFDYTFNNILGHSGKNFIGYQPEQDEKIVINSLTDSYHKQSSKSLGAVTKIKPMNIGLKVQFAFNL